MSGIFTLDSLLALIITFFIITASLYLVMQPEVSRDEYLYQLSLDILTSNEKNDGFERALDGDLGTLEYSKLMLPNSVCYQLEIMNESNTLVFFDDTDCELPESYSIGRRSFIAEDNFYIASLRVWFK